MANPEEILQRLYAAGFELETFERFPKAIGVRKGECIALLVPSADGLQILGAPGWKIGENLGVLATVNGSQVFQFKAETVEATPARLEQLRAFTAELKEQLALRSA